MLKVHHDAGTYDVCTELGEYFGRVVRIHPHPTDDDEDELPRVHEFDLHTFLTVYKQLPNVIEFDTVGFTDTDGRKHDSLIP